MPRIVVNVMPKPELLDPQGKAITRALARNGFAVADVRQGKRFELTVDGPVTPELHAAVERVAADILSNSVIEDVVSIDIAE
ncbi:MAG: phosphoribosylformylglycinamidine synthase subunit PurS [Agromyces sp.]